MRILIVEPGQAPREADVPNELKVLQEIVGGYIEVVQPFEEQDVLLVCGKEGRLKGKPENMCGIVGTFFLCGRDGENFAGLDEERMKLFKSLFGGGTA